MANSDWARETPQKEEIRWFYFQPVLDQAIEPGWQASVHGYWWQEAVGILPEIPIHDGDLLLFWRKPYTSKGN